MVRVSIRSAGNLAVLLVVLTGCMDKRAVLKTMPLQGEDKAVVTSADVRTIIHVKPAGFTHGRVQPAFITCAEPSPDVATAVSQAFHLGADVSVQGLPQNINPQLAMAMSAAYAQALAQLTERLATMQLLRDGLHRACEAYANGAISDTTYALILSRFDKALVTMLLGELAAGATGRSLAALGVEASGKAASDHAAAEPQATVKTDADSTAKPGTVSPAGAMTINRDATVPKTLFDMQRKYIENINFDPLEVACISALDKAQLPNGIQAFPQRDQRQDMRDVQELSVFAYYCLHEHLPALVGAKIKLLDAIIGRAEADRHAAEQREQITKTIESFIAYRNSIAPLLQSPLPISALTPSTVSRSPAQ